MASRVLYYRCGTTIPDSPYSLKSRIDRDDQLSEDGLILSTPPKSSVMYIGKKLDHEIFLQFL